MILGDRPREDCRAFPKDPTKWGRGYEFAHLVVEELGLLDSAHWTWLSWCAPAPGTAVEKATLQRGIETFLTELELVSPELLIVVGRRARVALLDHQIRPSELRQARAEALREVIGIDIDPEADFKLLVTPGNHHPYPAIQRRLREACSGLGALAKPAPMSDDEFAEKLVGAYYGRYRDCPDPLSPTAGHQQTGLSDDELNAFADLFVGDVGFRCQDPALPWGWITDKTRRWTQKQYREAVRKHLIGQETLAAFYPSGISAMGYAIAYDVDLHDEHQRVVSKKTMAALRKLAPEAYWVTSPRGAHGWLFSDLQKPPIDLAEAAVELELALLENDLQYAQFGDLRVRLVEVLPKRGRGLRLPFGPLSYPMYGRGVGRDSTVAEKVRHLLAHATGRGSRSYERFRDRVSKSRGVSRKRAASNAFRKNDRELYRSRPELPSHEWDEFFTTFMSRRPNLNLPWKHGIPAYGMRQDLTSSMVHRLFSLGFIPSIAAGIIEEWLGRADHVSRDLRDDYDGTIEEAVAKIAKTTRQDQQAYMPRWAPPLTDHTMLEQMRIHEGDLQQVQQKLAGQSRDLVLKALRVVVWFRCHAAKEMPISQGMWMKLLGSTYLAPRAELCRLGVLAGQLRGPLGHQPWPGTSTTTTTAGEVLKFKLMLDEPAGKKLLTWNEAIERLHEWP
jgi:hypothetical protein